MFALKNKYSLLAVFITLSTQLFSATQKVEPRIDPQPTLELKNGYFFFTDSKLRKIYDTGGWDLQFSGSYPVLSWLQIYGSVEYLLANGRSLFDKQKTSIWEVPISAGLKGIVSICSWAQYYVTLGPRYVFVHQHNNSPFVDKNVNQNGIGGFANTGFNLIFWRHFLVDIFGEYSYVRMKFNTHKKGEQGRNIQVGGGVVGVGLGYSF